MDWISVRDELPPIGTLCWVCDADGDVYDSYFHDRCIDEKRLGTNYICGFSCASSWADLIKDEIVYWMPYFTPEPPNE